MNDKTYVVHYRINEPYRFNSTILKIHKNLTDVINTTSRIYDCTLREFGSYEDATKWAMGFAEECLKHGEAVSVHHE